MNKKRSSALVVLGAVALLVTGCSSGNDSEASAGSPSGQNQTAGIENSITATGTGTVAGTPDTAQITLGVETRGDSAQAALAENNQKMQSVIDALKGSGIAEKDIQTVGLSVFTDVDEKGALRSYIVSNSVVATLRELDRAGDVIDSAARIAENAIRVNGISFYVDDTTQLAADARKQAVQRAKAQAEQMAKAAGVKVGDPIAVTDLSTNADPLAYTGAEAAKAVAADAFSVPVAEGSQSIQVNVQVVFEINQ